MDKQTSIIALALVLVVLVAAGGWWWLNSRGSAPAAQSQQEVIATNPVDATYIVEGKPVTLTNGEAEQEAAPGSAAKIVTRIFGEPIAGDLNGDGLPDAATFLVQEPGGTGTFFYIAAAIQQKNGGYVGTNALLLGDRIAPQTVEIKNGVLIANYADRKPDEPFSVRPSVGISKYTRLSGDTLVEIQPPN